MVASKTTKLPLDCVTLDFPCSSQQRSRTLVVRNPTENDLYFKVCASDSAVKVDDHNAFIAAGSTHDVRVDLGPGTKAPATFGYLSVHARHMPRHFPIEDLMNWIDGRVPHPYDVAYRLPVRRLKAYAPLETVIDLPGSALLIEPHFDGIIGEDDNDTSTACDINDDTRTADYFTMNELTDALPSETQLPTCINIVADAYTARNPAEDVITARNIYYVPSFLQNILDYIFSPAISHAILPDSYYSLSAESSTTTAVRP